MIHCIFPYYNDIWLLLDKDFGDYTRLAIRGGSKDEIHARFHAISAAIATVPHYFMPIVE